MRRLNVLLYDLRWYRSFLKAKRNGFNGTFRDYERCVLEDYISSMKMPDKYLDVNGDKVYKFIWASKDGRKYYENSSFYFVGPEKMSQDDVLKVVSHNLFYFTTYYKNENIDYAKVLEKNLRDMFDFKIIPASLVQEADVIDLVYTDQLDFDFINSKFYKNHFRWFQEFQRISEEDIIKIYEGLESPVVKKLRGE